MSNATETWLTQEAFDRLTEELAERSGPRRRTIVKRIEAAREEGDLKENGGYHAAKEEQGKNEARVKVLRHLLENAKIGAPAADDGEVAQGQVVTVRFPAFDEELRAAMGELGYYAASSLEQRLVSGLERIQRQGVALAETEEPMPPPRPNLEPDYIPNPPLDGAPPVPSFASTKSSTSQITKPIARRRKPASAPHRGLPYLS